MDAARLGAALADRFCSVVKPGKKEILDVDDTFCAAHGGQQLAFWNAHEDERGFSPMHIYHVRSGTPVVAILRAAKTPKGSEVKTVVKHVTRRIRAHWPKTRLIWRGDSHYGRDEAMEWAENNDADYIFGLGGNTVLAASVARQADWLHIRHAFSGKDKMRSYASGERCPRVHIVPPARDQLAGYPATSLCIENWNCEQSQTTRRTGKAP